MAGIAPRSFALLLATLLAACTPAQSRRPLVVAQAPTAALDSHGFVSSVVPSAVGPVRIWQRGVAGAELIHVYIEGDGHAWLSATRPSGDPTPRRAVGRALAARDPAPAVIYLGRPCQYADARELASCDRRYWTSHRYAEAVIATFDTLLDTHLRGRLPAARLGLIGYSGGAAVATLLAARRNDVDWVIGIAGNLDLAAWTAHHGVSALDQSLDPRQVVQRLHELPQVLFLGARDTIVPPAVLDAYRAAAGPAFATRLFDDFDHSCCWESVWPGAACAALTAVGATGTAFCAR